MDFRLLNYQLGHEQEAVGLLARIDRHEIVQIHGLVHTVDGRNPAPVGRWFLPSFTRFYTSQVVQDFLHQQYLTYEYQPEILKGEIIHHDFPRDDTSV